MAASISQRDFAGRVGVSRQYIGRLCAQGKLPTLHDKSIPMPEGLRAFHAMRADDQAAAQPPPQASADAPLSPAPAPTRDSFTYAADIRLSTELRKAQLVERAHRARLLELDYEERRGLLVTIADVRADARAMCEQIREGLLALGPRVALLLEAVCARDGAPRAPAIQAVIDDEVNALLVTLHTSRYAAPEISQQPSGSTR